MFADDTNLFYSNKDINTAFLKVNNELQKINEWFISNKLSLNVTKTKYSLFHKPSKKDDIPLVLPKLNINNWKIHIKYIENKISKNIGILFKARSFLDKKSLLTFYYFVYSQLHKLWQRLFEEHLQKKIEKK